MRALAEGRRGFTLIELLVVIAIVGILLSLTVAAVQRVSLAARETECKQHLSQFGKAFHNHHSVHGFFPSGGWDWTDPPSYIVPGTPIVGADQKAGWGFQILPFIEQESVWRSGAEVAIATPNPLFFCPVRRSPQTVTYADEYSPPVTGALLTHALCDYAGSNWEGTGLVRRYKPVRMEEATDGLGNTLLLSEKRLNLTDLGQNQPDDNEGYTSGWDEDTIRTTLLPPLPDFFGTGYDVEGRFGSSHLGGINVLLGDGSVRTISYAIDPTIFQNLGNKSDGAIIDFQSF